MKYNISEQQDAIQFISKVTYILVKITEQYRLWKTYNWKKKNPVLNKFYKKIVSIYGSTYTRVIGLCPLWKQSIWLKEIVIDDHLQNMLKI